MEQFRAGSRAELAEKEDQEAVLLQALPAPALSEDEVRGLIANAIADVGGVMKAVMPHTKGRFDGKELNRLVREALAG